MIAADFPAKMIAFAFGAEPLRFRGEAADELIRIAVRTGTSVKDTEFPRHVV